MVREAMADPNDRRGRTQASCLAAEDRPLHRNLAGAGRAAAARSLPLVSELDGVLAQQLRYYRARAPNYLDGALDEDEAGQVVAEVTAAFDVHCRGDVLELACGPGTWTGQLAERARTLTAVDGAPEMLELAAAAAGGDRVRFECVDLFQWRPARRYDAVFFGFWLSHVPDERWSGFWSAVADSLAPGGRVLFVDDAYRTEDELVYGADTSIIERRLGDGSAHRIIKVARDAAGVQRRLVDEGWDASVRQLGVFFWGVAAPQGSPSK